MPAIRRTVTAKTTRTISRAANNSSEVDTLKKELSRYKTIVFNLKAENTRLKSNYESEIRSLNARIQSLNERITELEHELEEERKKHDPVDPEDVLDDELRDEIPSDNILED